MNCRISDTGPCVSTQGYSRFADSGPDPVPLLDVRQLKVCVCVSVCVFACVCVDDGVLHENFCCGVADGRVVC